MVAIPERARVSPTIARGAARRGYAVRDRRGAERRRPTGRSTPVAGALQRQDRRPEGLAPRALARASSTALAAAATPRGPRLARALGLRRSASARAACRPTTCATSAAAATPASCVNQPARGMTGWNWDCSEECYRHAPELYGAIHFHDDDLDDCRWETDVALEIPADLAQRRLCAARRARARPRTTFRSSCCPPRGTATADIAVPRARPPATSPTPTTTSSHDVPVAQSILGHTSVHLRAGLLPLRQPRHRALDLRRALRRRAASASRRRAGRSSTCGPTFRHATGSVWQFPADLHLVDWLRRGGLRLRRRDRPRAAPRGRRSAAPLPRRADRLAPRVLLASACSTPGRSTWRRRARHVPRLERLLLGDVVAPREAVDDRGAQVRVRARAHGRPSPASTTTRPAASAAGSGAAARARRRSSSASGFTSEGFDRCVGFQQMADARDPRAAFIMEAWPDR